MTVKEELVHLKDTQLIRTVTYLLIQKLHIYKITKTSSAQLRSAQISSALNEYLIKLSSNSYLIKLFQ